MNWKLDKYYSFKEMPLPEKIWNIFIYMVVFGLVIFWIISADFSEINWNYWSG